MNVKLLRKVKKHILEEPKRLYMSDYIKLEGESFIGREYAKCGTAACIAGWTCILSLKELEPKKIKHSINENEKAAELLGISGSTAHRLFIPTNWPERFQGGCSDDGTEGTAKLAAARIEHFIKTKGRE
jgi:hypothetical protein